MMRRAVFLDRDGVINQAVSRNGTPVAPTSPDEVEVLPDVPRALQALKAAGYLLVVVTNQPDVARGKVPQSNVELIHERLQRELPLDAILACFHDNADECECRKPKPGLLLRAAQELHIDLASSFMVGDRWCDVEAGQRAGCCTFFVDRDYEEQQPTTEDFRVGSLGEAAGIVLALTGQ
jgi:D-glycero-D-manno-heptose 1,7-bisphosphate phosphatase